MASKLYDDSPCTDPWDTGPASLCESMSIAPLIDDPEQCKELCCKHQKCKLVKMTGGKCYISKFQETCGGESTQISHLRLNSASENTKKHCGALDALGKAVGIEINSEDANDGKCIAEAIKKVKLVMLMAWMKCHM